MLKRISTKLIVLLVLLVTMPAACAPGQSLDRSLREITQPYTFNLLKWEFDICKASIGQKDFEININDVISYFDAIERMRSLESAIELNSGKKSVNTSHESLNTELDTLKHQTAAKTVAIEKLLGKQVRETLSELGIFNPLYHVLKLSAGFPPVNFKLDSPPHLLIISPREKIESLDEVLLKQVLSAEDKETIEASTDALGVSSLVEELGGFAVYPSFVTNRAGLKFTIDTIIEEWLHQYLAFKPLGFRYLLDLSGIRPNYEIATMNETVAGIVSDEISEILYRKYYAPHIQYSSQSKTNTGFDFNQAMREIRMNVDAYLAQGEIEEAEQYMEEKRQYLEDNGYYIRKLNQAYFAFHGTYADEPTSIDPIGAELKQLRASSSSPAEFLETAAALTSRQDLSQMLKQVSGKVQSLTLIRHSPH
ncbi:MAG: hypothetical protein PHR43_07075 [Dehalococcoidales bacterium]|nr:hypothetical protein [Dehalococcoidales bacterium]